MSHLLVCDALYHDGRNELEDEPPGPRSRRMQLYVGFERDSHSTAPFVCTL